MSDSGRAGLRRAPPDPARALPRRRAAAGAAAAAGQVLAPFVLFTAVWALVVGVTRWPEDVLPSPFAVARAFGDVFAKGMLTVYAGETIRRIVLAAVTGVTIGIAAGFVMGLNDWIAALLN
ncbi:MAG TPA: hypothetical protein VK881_10895, partial [bacterium]|nr:hypothetical protein [bacterium]